MIALLFLLCAFSVVSASYDLIAEISSFNQSVGIYFPGEAIAEHEIYSYTLPEHFLQVVEPKSYGVEAVNYKTSLLIRSSDLKIRVLLDFVASPEEEAKTTGNLYQLTFWNLAWGDREGDAPIELQHSETDFAWIDGNMRSFKYLL